MLKYLKISASALALSALVLAPATTVITADYAYAKSDNAGGKGGGKGAGKGKSGDKGAKGNKGKKSAKASGKNWKSGKSSKAKNTRTIQDDLKVFKKGGFKALLGQGKNNKPARSVTASKAATSKKDDPLHPSNLGKMNGFLNSSPNAKLAHIANGQYLSGSGPVSLAAGLAVAKYEFEEVEVAVDVITAADAYEALNAFDEDEINAADALYEEYDENGNGIFDDEDLEAMEEDEVTPEEIADAEAVREAQEGIIDPDTGEAYDEPTEEEIADAEETLSDFGDDEDPLETVGDALDDAEAAALATYKGDFDALDEDEQQEVLDAMHDALPADEDIEDALAKYDTKYGDEETDDGTDPDDSASADDEIIETDEDVSEG